MNECKNSAREIPYSCMFFELTDDRLLLLSLSLELKFGRKVECPVDAAMLGFQSDIFRFQSDQSSPVESSLVGQSASESCAAISEHLL